MKQFYDLDFNQFTVIEHKTLPKLETFYGNNISDWSFSGSISVIWENNKRDMWSLKSTDDRDDMEWFEDIVKEFNDNATQEEWDDYYQEVRNHLIQSYKNTIVEYTEKLQSLLDGDTSQEKQIIV